MLYSSVNFGNKLIVKLGNFKFYYFNMWQAVVQIAAAEAQFNKIVTNPTE
jgi:hypothetical protein